MIEMLRQLNSRVFSPTPSFTARCLWCNQRLLHKPGVLELRWGRTIDHKWPQCLGRFVRYHPVRVNSNQYMLFFMGVKHVFFNYDKKVYSSSMFEKTEAEYLNLRKKKRRLDKAV